MAHRRRTRVQLPRVAVAGNARGVPQSAGVHVLGASHGGAEKLQGAVVAQSHGEVRERRRVARALPVHDDVQEGRRRRVEHHPRAGGAGPGVALRHRPRARRRAHEVQGAPRRVQERARPRTRAREAQRRAPDAQGAPPGEEGGCRTQKTRTPQGETASSRALGKDDGRRLRLLRRGTATDEQQKGAKEKESASGEEGGDWRWRTPPYLLSTVSVCVGVSSISLRGRRWLRERSVSRL
mmetsp:Transcript_2890/g.10524  ORF Transcript_2890/g.10524 Transcript_2890/m.10524 type:complete len:238 (+) Transcript_2890:1064-1777(+)